MVASGHVPSRVCLTPSLELLDGQITTRSNPPRASKISECPCRSTDSSLGANLKGTRKTTHLGSRRDFHLEFLICSMLIGPLAKGRTMQRRAANVIATSLPLLVFMVFCWACLVMTPEAYSQQKGTPPPGGKQDQPEPKDSQSDKKGTTKTSSTTAVSSVTDDTKALLSSPDAREAAVFKCASIQTGKDNKTETGLHSFGCPLEVELPETYGARSKRLADVLARRASQPLKTGTNQDTGLAVAIKKLLTLAYNAEMVFEAQAPYAIVHLVDRQGAVGQARQAAEDAAKAAGKENAATEGSDAGKEHEPRDRWIVAKRKGNVIELSEGQRILGAKTLSLVFVHVNATILPGENPVDVFGDISYRAIVKGKLPVNIANLLGLLQVAASLQARVEEKPIAFMGFGTISPVTVPSDITTFAVEPHAATLKIVGQPGKFDNEGKYWWDASIGVPINKLTMLDYAEENQSFIPKTINKQSVYGMINLFYPMDLKSGTLRWIVPRAVAGFGLTGRPGENFLIGGAWGIQQLQFFVGSGFANHRYLPPGADPKNGANYQQRYGSHLTYGINVPVVSAIKKLTTKKDSDASGGGSDSTAKSGTKK